jgi:hypothetical protein
MNKEGLLSLGITHILAIQAECEIGGKPLYPKV